MPRISRHSFREVQHRNQRHIYTFQRYLRGVRIRQSGEIGDTKFDCIPSISLPRGAITIPLLTIPMTGIVNCIVFSPGGNRIVSGSNDKSLRVWDAKTGQQLWQLQGHGGRATSVAFSPDGNRIISGSNDKSVWVWDAKTGEQLRKLQGHAGRVQSVAFSFDGERIVSVSDDKSVRVWNAKTGEQLIEVQGHTYRVTFVAFSPDGNQIFSDSLDKLRIWDANTL